LQQTLEQWHKVFYIASLVYIFGCVLYLFFGSGEVEPWNNTVEDSKKEAVVPTVLQQQMSH
jgi:ACS family sodium-dependent inorganic phosphate cotransporter